MPARVATAGETVACERATIAAGTTARELMERAGRAAADEIIRRFRLLLPGGAAVFTGPGNNGGDGWVVARCLAESGFPVTVIEAARAKTDEAREAEASAGMPAAPREVEPGDEMLALQVPGEIHVGDAPVVIDALLGTGATGAPHGAVAAAVDVINNAGSEGAVVVALDVPSGVDATTGVHELCVHADLTLTFGLVKRGHLLARDVCGEIVVVDIGLATGATINALPLLVDRVWAAQRIPDIPVDAHKGTRGRVAIVAGGDGMAGAAILAGKGALRSGIGLLHVVVARENIVSIHAGLPEAIVHVWPAGAEELSALVANADALAIGPGLGKSSTTRDLVERVLLAWQGPVVVDADALNVFERDAESLAALLRGRPAVITPHPAELGRLLGVETNEVVASRFEIGAEFARDSGSAVLLKGVPTVVFGARGERFISPAGTPALATGGSGDVLTGIVGTLLAQMIGPSGSTSAEVAALAAFVHGRAAELCGPVRGTTLDDILLALPDAWNESAEPTPDEVLAWVPALP
jgi:hydroxyethylthiazole kinase-like uncharacterized protein yjeF